jgi:hypothetical protein
MRSIPRSIGITARRKAAVSFEGCACCTLGARHATMGVFLVLPPELSTHAGIAARNAGIAADQKGRKLRSAELWAGRVRSSRRVRAGCARLKIAGCMRDTSQHGQGPRRSRSDRQTSSSPRRCGFIGLSSSTRNRGRIRLDFCRRKFNSLYRQEPTQSNHKVQPALRSTTAAPVLA